MESELRPFASLLLFWVCLAPLQELGLLLLVDSLLAALTRPGVKATGSCALGGAAPPLAGLLTAQQSSVGPFLQMALALTSAGPLGPWDPSRTPLPGPTSPTALQRVQAPAPCSRSR